MSQKTLNFTDKILALQDKNVITGIDLYKCNIKQIDSLYEISVKPRLLWSNEDHDTISKIRTGKPSKSIGTFSEE